MNHRATGLPARRRRRISAFDVGNVLLFLVLNIIMLFPFWSILMTSFVTSGEAMRKTLILWPETFNLSSYQFLLSSSRIPRSFFITVASTLCATAWSMLQTTTIAYALSKRYLVGRNFLILLIVLTMFLDGGLIPYYLLVTKTLRLQNTFLVLFITRSFTVTYFVMNKAFFNQIPDSLEESAKIDGANDIFIFVRIILPLSLPALATFSLFYAVGAWNQYFEPMLFTNSRPDLHTLQLVLRKIIVENSTKEFDQTMKQLYGGVAVFEDGVKYAAVMVATLPILIVYPFIQKYFTKGIFIGSVKG